MMAALWGVLLGILAGWVVNILADAIPPRRSLWRTWRLPLQQLGFMSTNRQCEITGDAGSLSAPRRYLLVWLSAIALGWLTFAQFGWTLKAVLIAMEVWYFLAIAVIDFEHRLVLNRMLLVAAPFALTANLLIGDTTIFSAVCGAAAGFGLLLCIALLVPGGMGMGDVKLTALIGLTTGLSGVMFALYIGILAGGIAGIVMLIKSRFHRGQTMAYAPYLVIGAWVVLLDGAEWLRHYLQYL